MANVRALLPMAATVLVIAGCGGGGDEKPATTAARALSHQQLVSRGNQVCIDTDRAVQDLGQPTRTAAYWVKLIPLSQEALAKMDALEPNAADRANFEKMMRLARQEVAAIAKIRDRLKAGKTEQARTQLRVATALDTKVKFAAKDVGFEFCSQLLSNWPA